MYKTHEPIKCEDCNNTYIYRGFIIDPVPEYMDDGTVWQASFPDSTGKITIFRGNLALTVIEQINQYWDRKCKVYEAAI